MTYSTLLQSEESLRSEYLAILVPRRLITGWTVVTGFIYSASYSLGDIDSVEENGVTLSEGSSTTVGAGEWYLSGSTLYVRTLQSADPDTINLVVNYRLYVATIDSYFNSDPLDSSSEIVYYEPIIKQSPQIKLSISDSLFGALPVQSSSIKLINAEHSLEQHIYASSFNKGSIRVYHWIDTLETANVDLVYDGFMGDVSYDTSEITIKTTDRFDELTKEFRNSNTSFFNSTDFPNCDPNLIGKPIRYVYGYVKGFVPVNVDYVSTSPTTSDNRDYVVVGNQTGLTEISRTVSVSPASTTTRTYLNFVEGIQVGDTVFLDRVVGVDEYKEVTSVSISPAYIEHSALAGAMASGDAVKKGFVSRVDIVQNGAIYTAKYGRDYTINLAMSAGCSGFSFSTSLEANLSMPETLGANDQIFCTVYGRVNDLTLSGGSFGANDLYSNNITNPIMIIYDLLKTRLGIAESAINLTQFASVRTATATEGLGISIPYNRTSNFPTYKQIILDILQTSLLKIFIDNDLKWTVAQVAPVGSNTKSIASDDIYANSFGYDFEYKDILSDITVEYLRKESSFENTSESSSNVTAASNIARYTHKVEKGKTFKSLYFRSSDAQTLANHLAYALGDRAGSISFATNRKFFNTVIGDVVGISREQMPNFTYVDGTDRTISASVQDITKSLNRVTINLDDQKGIQDNSGSW